MLLIWRSTFQFLSRWLVGGQGTKETEHILVVQDQCMLEYVIQINHLFLFKKKNQSRFIRARTDSIHMEQPSSFFKFWQFFIELQPFKKMKRKILVDNPHHFIRSVILTKVRRHYFYFTSLHTCVYSIWKLSWQNISQRRRTNWMGFWSTS